MTTANVFVTNALELIGSSSPIKKPLAEVTNKTFIVLQDMLFLWSSQGISTGLTLPTVIGDDLEEPASTRLAIEFNLAVTAAPYLQKEPTQFVSAKARQTMQALRSQFSPLPVTLYPGTLPLGSGNKVRPLGQVYYPDQETIDSESGTPIIT